MRHVTLALRTLRRTPFVTAVAILSLALGIGANAAIFSLFDQLLLRSLPVPEPTRLVAFSAPGPKPGSTSCNQAGDCDEVFSYPMFRDLQREQTVFTDIAAHRLFGATIVVDNQPLPGEGVLVSGSYFPVLQLQAAAGRLLTPADDDAIAGHYVAVLGHDYWTTQFGADPAVVGRTIIVNGKSLEVIGVAPEGFRGTTAGARPLIYVPITLRAELDWGGEFENRRAYWLYAFGRLNPGVSMEQARVAMEAAYRPIITDVEASLQEGMSDQTLAQFRTKPLLLSEGRRGQSSIHEEATTPLYLLFGVTGVVLLIACANIANLLLARGAGRATEMGVRLALGAGRRHLVTQLLVESLLLALAGGVASVAVAQWTLAGIGAILPSDAADVLQLTLDGRMIAFAAVLAVVTGLAFGLFPALHSTRDDLIGSIRAGAGQITGGGRTASRFRVALATVQVALAMMLLSASGLFLRSLVNVSRVDLGVDIENTLTFSIAPVNAGYDSTRSAVLFARLHEELAALPGVTDVTEAIVPLLSGNNWGNDVRVQGFAHGPDVDANSRFNMIGAGYFDAFGVRLKAGREFTAADTREATKVAIVNETFARKFGLGDDAVGKFMSQGGDSLDIQIVGLIPDIKYSDVKDETPPVFYVPWTQQPTLGWMGFYVRSTIPSEQLMASVRRIMQQLDPLVAVENMRTMEAQVRENIFLDRLITIMSSAFAVLATILAAVGLYGVLAYSVTQRTREIGVRMALGADASSVRRLVLRQVGWMFLVGGAAGLLAAFFIGRVAESQLFGMTGTDPVVFAAATALLAVIALVAGYLPARRATRIDPMLALRYD